MMLQMDEQGTDRPKDKEGKTHAIISIPEDRNKLIYCVTDVPPWYLCIFLAIQVGAVDFVLISNSY